VSVRGKLTVAAGGLFIAGLVLLFVAARSPVMSLVPASIATPGAPGNSADAASLPTTSEPTADEYSVYVAFLSTTSGSLIRAETDDTTNLDVRGAVNSAGAVLRDNWTVQRYFPVALATDLLASFDRVRKSPARLDAARLGVPNSKVILESEIAAILQSGGGLEDREASFERRYGGGYMVLSRVGFNQARNQALLGAAVWCGFLCGTGEYVLLTKRNARWQVTEQQRTWVS
jgi:hypothetical protein